MVPVKDGWMLLNAAVSIKETAVSVDGAYVTMQFDLDDKTVKVYHKYDFTGMPQEVTLDIAPESVNGMIYLPLRFVAETLGYKVGWDASIHTALVTEGNLTVKDAGLAIITDDISEILLYDIDGSLVKAVDKSEYTAIADACNTSIIENTMYPMMITGYRMEVKLHSGSSVSFISYGSETNTVASVTIGESHTSLHLRCPVIAKILIGK
jgi:hypothetical protein